MENQEELNKADMAAIEQDEKMFGNKIQSKPIPEVGIGISDKDVINDLLGAASKTGVDLSSLNSFLDVSRSRDQQYRIIDEMCQDSIPSAILESFTEDTTEMNESGKIIWATSDDDRIGKTVNNLIESLQVNKHISKWASSLIKYGDAYVRLYRQSEYEPDLLFNKNKNLNEDVNVHISSENDKLVNYIELVSNPATTYELTKFGKTAGFIQTQVAPVTSNANNPLKLNNYYKYSFNQSDIDVFEPNKFVHGSLDSNVDRTQEEVEIALDSSFKPSNGQEVKSLKYGVKSGQSVFYNAFRIWRELSLLENSLMLNRVTKSSILRIIQIETGNIAKEETNQIMQSVKQMIEQKIAVNPGMGIAEYNNPGPVENNIYMPTHDGKGQITTSQIGGDVNISDIADIDYFKNKFYGSLGVLKQYFGDTDDAAGFNGGTSLSVISSRYAKKVKSFQHALIEMVTTLINIFLIDRGLSNYVGKFTINMLPPTTQEDIDRQSNSSNKIAIVRDVMDLLTDIQDPSIKLKILKNLLTSIVNDPEVIGLIQEEIDNLEKETEENGEIELSQNSPKESPEEGNLNNLLRRNSTDFLDTNLELKQPEEGSLETENNEEVLPTGQEIGIDLTNPEDEE